MWIYGVISDEHLDETDVTPLDVIVALNGMHDADTITVHINSDGGDLYSGLAIYNTLRHCGKTVNVIGEGMVASIASVIALAGDTFTMAENATLMIHNPLVLLGGSFNKHDMAKMSAELDSARDSIVTVYTQKTGLPAEEIVRLLDANDGRGTYFNPQEALAAGFCDSVGPSARPAQMVASRTPKAFKCRGKTIRLHYDSGAAHTKERQITGGSTMQRKTRARRFFGIGAAKIRNEIVPIECPHCQTMLDFDTEAGIVSPLPEEHATVAVPLEPEVEARRSGRGRMRNELFRLTCPYCGGEFDYETDPSAGEVIIEETQEPYADPFAIPVMRKTKAKRVNRPGSKMTARKGRRLFMLEEDEPAEDAEGAPAEEQLPVDPVAAEEPVLVDVVCGTCGLAFEIDIDPNLEQATVICPDCGAEIPLQTEDANGDGAADDVTTEDPEDEAAVVAYRKGVRLERRRIAAINRCAQAHPQYARAMDTFIRNGSSTTCVMNWLTTALATNPSGRANPAGFRTAARNDAAVLARMGAPVAGQGRAATAAAEYDSLAQKRGTATKRGKK